jgi:phosphate transport system permease protein
MVIGNRPQLPSGVFDSSQTIASQIATTFNEASIGLQSSALIGLGLILLVITMTLNIVARLLVWRVSGAPEGH